jgi:hypothetical protein
MRLNMLLQQVQMRCYDNQGPGRAARQYAIFFQQSNDSFHIFRTPTTLLIVIQTDENLADDCSCVRSQSSCTAIHSRGNCFAMQHPSSTIAPSLVFLMSRELVALLMHGLPSYFLSTALGVFTEAAAAKHHEDDFDGVKERHDGGVELRERQSRSERNEEVRVILVSSDKSRQPIGDRRSFCSY